ncbi:MAG: DUF1996 domain-containing protein, partial [Myxococcaceae bacterium]
LREDMDAGGMGGGMDAGDGGMTMAQCTAATWFDGGQRPDGSVELDPIPSNFDAGAWLGPVAIPGSSAPDPVGAFRFICNASHLGYDDPIVYWGQPGCSHLHQFYGNTLANAFSTYESLRTTGESTCGDVLNRSAYWIPAMMNGKGKVVRPDYVAIYYKRYPKDSPECAKHATACVPMPRGLRFVFGWNKAEPGLPDVYRAWFNCDGTGLPADAGVVSGHFADIPTAAQNCPIGAHLGAIVNAPDCWDGKNLDSPDHRSHMAYEYDTHLGYTKCPDDHPYIIPTFTLGAWYTADADLDRSGTWTEGVTQTWSLSSDGVGAPSVTPGTTFHADWFGAWDDDTLTKWTDNCINKQLNCSGGNLGNGQEMKNFPGFSYVANPHLVDPPDSGM